ncbi:helix-turn-helix domain-containing protein [Synechococcus sp. CCY 9618]|uniref:helix-turn-helix domain-containing protein n=1 Tax=Synechococcus sp. CCY 9618 TaxID=2815602 RepID=UPI001C24020B|nr:helix-turn-helix domain-containing protein [Synechococcus sp. CCY 9618]
MAATRLSDSQKTELLERFRAGGSSQELAAALGCSPNTVTRVVRMALGDEEYERLKRQRQRRRGQPQADDAPQPQELQTALAIAGPVAVTEPEPGPDPAEAPDPDRNIRRLPDPPRRRTAAAPARDADGDEEEDGPAVLAIEDADDFGDDDDDDLLTDDDGSDDAADAEIDPFQPIAVVPVEEGDGAGSEARLQTLMAASLPASAYMLVDKTVELQARPLSEFPELGRLPPEELERQALVVFLNPRQAKRQCGRTQRVIKLPDLKVFERTAPYLLAQGISRVVIEGALYALPGS